MLINITGKIIISSQIPKSIRNIPQKAMNKDIEDPEVTWMSKNEVKLALKNKEFIGLTYATAALHWISNE